MSEVKSLLTPETTQPDESYLEGNSTGKSSSTTKREKVRSRYLKPSTGSCHDLCKYGRKEETEAKARLPFRKGIIKKPLDRDGQSSPEIEIFLPGRKKSSELKLDAASDTSINISDCCEVIKHEVSAESPGTGVSMEPEVSDGQCSVVSENLSSREKSPGVEATLSSYSKTHALDPHNINEQEMSVRPQNQNDIVAAGIDAQNLADTTVPIKGKKSLGPRLKPSPDRKLSASPNNIKHKLGKHSTDSRSSMVVEVMTDESKTSAGRHKSSHSKPRVSAVSQMTEKKLSPSPRVKASPKQASPTNQEKSVAVKVKPLTVKASTSPGSSGLSNGGMNGDVKLGMRKKSSKTTIKKAPLSPTSSAKVAGRKVVPSATISPKVAARKLMASPASPSPRPISTRASGSSSRKHRSLKVGSPLKNRDKIRKAKPNQLDVDEVEEKTLYVIKMDTASKSSVVNDNGNHASELHEKADVEESDYTIEDNSDLDNEGVAAMEGKPKRASRKVAKVASMDKDEKPLKSNFRRGKMLDVQSQSNSPRKLKFRQPRLLGNNQNGKVDFQRRTFKRRGEVDSNRKGDQAGSHKVVLKHQEDLLGKKDAKGLFNNVIEETASKLVESRKSKVKALVGAFETVISLQESKPATNSVTGDGNGASN